MRLFKQAMFTALLVSASTGHAQGPNLVVFVGEKVRIEKFDPSECKNCLLLSPRFRARYNVLQIVFGSLPPGELTFFASDHYAHLPGGPGFARNKHALLFVTKGDDGAFHLVSYQFVPVYKTTQGRWFGCGSPYGTDPHAQRRTWVDVEEVEFEQPVTFSIAGLTPERVEQQYPSEFFVIDGDRAHCKKGASAAGLFYARREEALRAVAGSR